MKEPKFRVKVVAYNRPRIKKKLSTDDGHPFFYVLGVMPDDIDFEIDVHRKIQGPRSINDKFESKKHPLSMNAKNI